MASDEKAIDEAPAAAPVARKDEPGEVGATSGGAALAKASPPSGNEVRLSVLRSLFASESTIQRLGAALAHYAKDADEQVRRVNELLTPLNTATDPPSDPGFTPSQVDGLFAVLRQEQYALVSPYDARTGEVRQQAQRFWRSLLSLDPDRLKAFHQKVIELRAAPDDDALLARVLDDVASFGVEGWGVAHAKALTDIDSIEARFRDLSWYDVGDAFW